MEEKRSMNVHENNITAVILCGGLGIRLQSHIPKNPKALAKIGDRAFLDFIVDGLVGVGIRDIVLCTGYLKEQIREHFSNRNDCTIVFSEEEGPLGTGGALKKALSLVKSDPFLVLNGDSVCSVSLSNFLKFHSTTQGAVLSMVLAPAERSDGGTAILNNEGAIARFEEKRTPPLDSFMNAGIYLMQKNIAQFFPTGDRFSLECDLFPKLPVQVRYGFPIKGKLIDIGTPERYEYAQHALVSFNSAKYFYGDL